MSGKERRSDGLLGERGNERRRAPQAPPVLHATALLLDSTPQALPAELARLLGAPRTARLRRVMRRHTGLPAEALLGLALDLLAHRAKK